MRGGESDSAEIPVRNRSTCSIPLRDRLLKVRSFGVGVAVAICVACAAQAGPLRVHPTNPRYFTDGSGKAIYVTGSHTWTNLTDQVADLPAFDFYEYLDFLQSHNHNFIRLWAANYNFQHDSPYVHPRTGPGNALDGKPRFDLSQIDRAYLKRLRIRVTAARDRGIYVSIMLFDGLHVALPEDWAREAYNGANNINGIDGDPDDNGIGSESYTLAIPALTAFQDAYVRKVIDTLNDFDNVLYEICNEAGPDSTAWQYHMIDLIHTYESGKPKQHLVGMTFQAPGGSNQALFDSGAKWISPNDADGYTNGPPAGTGSKVVLVDTDHLCGTCADRMWPWKNFLRGHNFLLMDPYYPNVSGPSFEQTRKAMGDTLNYAHKMNLAATTPQPSLSSTGYVLANPGSEYLVYQDSSGPFTVNLQAGDYAYEWFDPSTGNVVQTGALSAASGSSSFSPPFSGDAVLYLLPEPRALPGLGAGCALLVWLSRRRNNR
jgi:Family of unknown function (DUF6298)/Putative collagen-binding domain of a collagenase